MSRIFKILSIFVVVVTILTVSAFSPLSKRTVAYSSLNIIDKRLENAVVMYLGSPMAYVNGNKVKIDASNQEIAPIIKNNIILVPLRFIAESFGAEVEWDGKTSSVGIVLHEMKIFVKQGSTIMKVDDSEFKLDVPVQAIESRTFVPLEQFAEVMGKKIFIEQDLIILSDKENNFDPETDKDLINVLISDVGQLPVVGSYERLVELFQEAENEKYCGDIRFGISFSGGMDKTTATKAPNQNQNTIAIESREKATIEAPAQKVNSEAKKDEASYSGMEVDSDYSGTNVQVQGVDEADVVKTDGEYIYQVNQQRIVIVKAYPSEKMKVESIIDLNETNFNPVEMYIHGNKLVVIGNSYVNYIIPQKDTVEKDTEEKDTEKKDIEKSNDLTEKDSVNQIQENDAIQVQKKIL